MPEAGAGPSLSDEGRQQAAAAAEHLAAWRTALPPLVGLYTSPLLRTAQTAAVIGDVLGLAPATEPGLADCATGDWAGTPLRQLAKKPEWGTVIHYPSGFRFPGGEPMIDMRSRVLSTLMELVGAHRGQAIVVVSHADPIKAVLADALGMHLDLFQRIVVSPASVSAVTYSVTGPRVMLMNWTGSQPGAPTAKTLTTGAAPRSRR